MIWAGRIISALAVLFKVNWLPWSVFQICGVAIHSA
jgi:hypothetical protein